MDNCKVEQKDLCRHQILITHCSKCQMPIFLLCQKELGLKIPKVLNRDIIYPELKRIQKSCRFDFCFDNQYQYNFNLDSRYYRYLKKYIGLDSRYLFNGKNPKLSFVTIILSEKLNLIMGFVPDYWQNIHISQLTI
jgi:hypothetical protein